MIIKEEIKQNTLIKKDDDEKIYDDTLIYIYCDKKVNQDKYREMKIELLVFSGLGWGLVSKSTEKQNFYFIFKRK